METVRRFGFTLIELLTVIAIIAILAAITATVLPGVRRRARITRCEATFTNLRTAVSQYYANNGTYPPAYGYVRWQSRRKDLGDLRPDDYHRVPVLAFVNQEKERALYDEFSRSYDTNDDGVVQVMEFSPASKLDIFRVPEAAGGQLYPGGMSAGALGQEYAFDNRPFVYVPVYERHFEKVKAYYDANLPALINTVTTPWQLLPWKWPWDETKIRFPAPKYDAFVMVSVGPYNDTFGLVSLPPFEEGPDSMTLGEWTAYYGKYRYHIEALRTYYVLTRDLDENGRLDFDCRARERQGEAGIPDNSLPDLKAPWGAGPLIFKP